MQQQRSNILVQDLPDDSFETPQIPNAQMLGEAFDALPDAVYLFGSNRRLLRSNGPAAQLQTGQLLNGRLCCEMFWRVEGAESCVVDRALQTGEKVEVEILAGADGNKAISIMDLAFRRPTVSSRATKERLSL